ncbi:unnamed protein product [Discosporangium mesarthrocarpum]
MAGDSFAPEVGVDVDDIITDQIETLPKGTASSNRAGAGDPPLSEEFRHKVDELRKLVSDNPNHDTGLAMDNALTRFLEGNDWDVPLAKTQLEATLAWRKEYQPWLPCHYCKEDPLAHSLRIVGMDEYRQPVLYTVISQSRLSHHGESCLRHMCWVLEQAQELLAKEGCPTSQKWSIVCDFHGFGVKDCNPYTGLLCARALAHYPERLHALWLLDSPRLFRGTWAVIKPALKKVGIAFERLPHLLVLLPPGGGDTELNPFQSCLNCFL